MNKHQQNLLINGLLGLLIILVLIKIISKKHGNEAFKNYNITAEEEGNIVVEEEELNNNPDYIPDNIPYYKSGNKGRANGRNNNKINHKGANVRIVPGKDVNVRARKFNGVLNIYSPDIKK